MTISDVEFGAPRLPSADMGPARCSGRGEAWSTLEARHHRAQNGWTGRALVQLMREQYCTDCPALLWCARWATETGYTGLAAGFPYVGGERQESTWVPRQGLAARALPRDPA